VSPAGLPTHNRMFRFAFIQMPELGTTEVSGWSLLSSQRKMDCRKKMDRRVKPAMTGGGAPTFTYNLLSPPYAAIGSSRWNLGVQGPDQTSRAPAEAGVGDRRHAVSSMPAANVAAASSAGRAPHMVREDRIVLGGLNVPARGRRITMRALRHAPFPSGGRGNIGGRQSPLLRTHRPMQ